MLLHFWMNISNKTLGINCWIKILIKYLCPIFKPWLSSHLSIKQPLYQTQLKLSEQGSMAVRLRSTLINQINSHNLTLIEVLLDYDIF